LTDHEADKKKKDEELALLDKSAADTKKYEKEIQNIE
jgi:hypothetical protein